MTPPLLPPEIRALKVTREMFITAQHYAAWVSGTPLRRHIPGRKKIDRELRELVYRDKGRRCVLTGSTANLTADHIVPVALGGATRLCNLRPLTESANRKYWQQYFADYLRQLDAYLKSVAAA